ncbi:MAG: hypothetical protein U0T75_16370 [Chitinophagales bacterium]
MNNTFKTLLLLGALTNLTPALHAGCICIPGSFTVVGNFTYDSIQGVYFFVQGDTLRITYHATDGGGDGYIENYYRDDSLLVGHQGDTLVVTTPCTLQAKIGCSFEQNTTSIRLAYNGFNAIGEVSSNAQLNAHCDDGTLSLLLQTGGASFPYQLQVYDVTGRLLLQEENLQAQTTYQLPLSYNGLKLLRVSYLLKGVWVAKTIKLY